PTTPATPPARQQRSPPTATRSAQANPYPLPPPRPIQPRQPVACSSGGPPSLIFVGSARHAPNQSGRAGGRPHKLLQPPGQRPAGSGGLWGVLQGRPVSGLADARTDRPSQARKPAPPVA